MTFLLNALKDRMNSILKGQLGGGHVKIYKTSVTRTGKKQIRDPIFGRITPSLQSDAMQHWTMDRGLLRPTRCALMSHTPNNMRGKLGDAHESEVKKKNTNATTKLRSIK